jgi:hypothetical protein
VSHDKGDVGCNGSHVDATREGASRAWTGVLPPQVHMHGQAPRPGDRNRVTGVGKGTEPRGSGEGSEEMPGQKHLDEPNAGERRLCLESEGDSEEQQPAYWAEHELGDWVSGTAQPRVRKSRGDGGSMRTKSGWGSMIE